MATRGDLIGGRYRLHEPVGRGGMGTVWMATDVVLGREVAVKEVVPPAGLDEAQRRILRERTLREARAAARLSIGSAVTVYDVVEEDDRPWIIMERLDAPTLAEVIRSSGKLPAAAVAEIGLALLDALEAAHASGVLHRDVKPSNVMLPPSGAVLTDFGIAALEDDPALTMTGMLVGSPAYMAPERARGEKASPASDLWSLGATLYAATEGHGPFDRDGQLATLHAVVSDPPADPVSAGPLAPALLGLLAKDPADRLDAATLRGMLERVAPRGAGTVPRGAATVPLDDVQQAAPTTAEEGVAAPAFHLPGEHTQAFPVGAAAPLGAHQQGTSYAPPSAYRPEAPAPRSRLTAVLVGLALLVVAGLAFAVILSMGDEPTAQQLQGPGRSPNPPADTGPPSPRDTSAGNPATQNSPNTPATQTSPSSPTATSPTATSPTDEPPQTNQGGVPPGFVEHTDPTGFRVAVPADWSVQRSSSTYVDFIDPETGGFLRIDQTNTPKPDPVADWEAQEASSWSQNFPGYKRIRIEPVEYNGWNAADAEFTYRGENGKVHVLNRGFVTAPDQAYALYWSMPQSAWAQSQDELSVVQQSFQPDE